MRAFSAYSSRQKVARDGEVALPACVVDLGNVAAGAEGAVAFRVDEDEGDVGIVAPGGEGGVDGAASSRSSWR